MDKQKIGFIGLGLIGGSIAKTVKRIYPQINIIALSGHQSTITQAYQEGLIDNETNLSASDFSGCDYIFLCTPVQQNLTYLKQLKPVISPDCILTDVGSVKGDIHRMVETCGLSGQFIGGHPMVGSEKTGLANATAYLLENAYYIITPGAGVAASKADDFRDFIASLGAIPLVLACDRHDHATAAISHLPHVVAAALVNLVRSADDSERIMKRIAAGGFRDITRIASSSPVMWQEICLENRDAILDMIRLFRGQLDHMEQSIAASDPDAIIDFFETAKDYRDSLNTSRGDSRKTVFEFYCDLIDEAGGIATIATILASNNLSIKNIGILHNREFEHGVLRIEMYDADSYHQSIALLQKYHYVIHER